MITVITGGTGSIKLIRGLDSVLDEKMTIITNVGDNIKLFGLYICPDIDTTLYGLSKQLDRERGWGIKNDTFNFRDSLKNISEVLSEAYTKHDAPHQWNVRFYKPGKIREYQIIKKI